LDLAIRLGRFTSFSPWAARPLTLAHPKGKELGGF
jgi:hypothetical protein